MLKSSYQGGAKYNPSCPFTKSLLILKSLSFLHPQVPFTSKIRGALGERELDEVRGEYPDEGQF